MAWPVFTLLALLLFDPHGVLRAQPRGAQRLNNVTWVAIGPAPSMDNGTTGYSEDTSGRIAAVAAHPNLPNIIYVAAAGGGVWRTLNGGGSWTALSDDQRTLFMGAIALAPSDPAVIYAGTGEAHMGPSKTNRHNIYYGLGVLKSVDSGGSWTLLGATEFYRRTISKIVVDRNDSNTVYVAVGALAVNGLPDGTGIWKSIDGGGSWLNTTSTISTTISTTAAFSDLVMDPTDSLTLYAAVGEPGGHEQNGVYKTTDGGAIWTPAGDFPMGADNGRISIALAASAPGTLYASVAGSPQSSSGLGRLYRLMKTTNGGMTWSRLTNPSTTICATTGSLRTNVFGTAGDYHNTVAVDPRAANIIYVAGICLIRNTSGGTGSWLALAEGTERGPHRDHHALVFDANDPPRLLDGNDGGIWRLAADGSWENLNTDLQITQFVGFDLHPSNPNLAHGGTQDTGIMKYTGDVRWLRQLRGDGGSFAVNSFSASSPPYRVYAIGRAGESDNNWFKRSSNSGDPNADGTRTWFTHISSEWCVAPPQDCQPKNFYPPFVLQSRSSPAQDRLLVGTDRIYESLNGGTSWQQTGVAGWTSSEAVDCVAVAPSDASTIYASAGGHIFVSADSGANWRQADVPGLSDPSFAALMVDPSISSTVYAVRDRFDGGHVFVSADAGVSWSDISGDLPNLPAYSVAVDTRATPNVLYVGTDSGVFVSRDGGTSWVVFGVGLPNAQVVQLKLSERLNILAAATHGRGVWEIQL